MDHFGLFLTINPLKSVFGRRQSHAPASSVNRFHDFFPMARVTVVVVLVVVVVMVMVGTWKIRDANKKAGAKL